MYKRHYYCDLSTPYNSIFENTQFDDKVKITKFYNIYGLLCCTFWSANKSANENRHTFPLR